MKKVLLSALLLMALTSCGKLFSDDPFEQFLAKPSYSPKSGWIWDFSPTVFQMMLSDSEGNDLLDPDFEGNWLDRPVVGTFEGKTYEGIATKAALPEPQTKMYLAIIKGFYIYSLDYTYTDQYILNFGELDSADKWDSDLVIDWPDGTRDVIRVQHAFRWKLNGDPEFYTGFKLNGEPVEGNIIYLQK